MIPHFKPKARENVRQSQEALARAILRKGASEVKIVQLPDLPSGKCGLDDYLLTHTAADFQQLVDATPLFTVESASTDGSGDTSKGHLKIDGITLTPGHYTVIGGSTFHCKVKYDEGVPEIFEKCRLANFRATIIGQVNRDNGIEQSQTLDIHVERTGRPAIEVNVPLSRFPALGWVIERCGSSYIIQAGNGKQDQLRCAIQELSELDGKDVPVRTIYTHTGWREIGGQWVFLHAGGAIVPTVPNVPVPAIEIALEGNASLFRLPAPPCGDELIRVVRSSLGILEGLAPDSLTFPLLADAYRAPIGGADYSGYMSGLTGVQKSELAALAEQHFGPENDSEETSGELVIDRQRP